MGKENVLLVFCIISVFLIFSVGISLTLKHANRPYVIQIWKDDTLFTKVNKTVFELNTKIKLNNTSLELLKEIKYKDSLLAVDYINKIKVLK